MTMKRAGKREWPSRVLVLHLITWEGGASFLDQSRTITKQKYPFWLVWNRRKQVVCFIWQENQSNVLQVCPFPCGCVGELWIMLIHLMDHLSTKTDLEVWVTSSVDNHCWSHIVVGRLLFNMVAEKFWLKTPSADLFSPSLFFQSFWSAVSSIMSEILYPKESEPDSQDSTVQPWAQSCGRYK